MKAAGAFRVEDLAFEIIDGLVELDVANSFDLGFLFRVEAFEAAEDALEVESFLLFETHLNDGIGSDAAFVNHLVAGGVIFGGGEAESGTIVKRHDALDGTFAEGCFPDDKGALHILEAA